MGASLTTDFKASGPFGDPDGSRADLDIERVFIGFTEPARFGGLATARNDLTARVLVGRKGAGKTLYLRRLQAYCSYKDDIYASSIERDVPQTRDIVDLCHRLPVNTVTNVWQLMWRRAIFRALHSIVLTNESIRDKVAKENLALLRSFDDIIPSFGSQVTVYSQITSIIRNYKTKSQLENYLSHDRWAEYEGLIRRVMHNFPPICLFIDSIDDEMKHAPTEWHRCQKGLFYAVIHFLQDQDLGGRLHIFITVREIVYASVLHGEHATRYIGDSHIRVLEWNVDALNYFIKRKLESLPKEYILNPGSSPTTFSEWLGISKINNTERKIYENVDKYLLRHTRMLPRDLIIFGNMMADEVYMGKVQGQKAISEDRIKHVVEQCAAIFGREQLEVCANHLSTMYMPPGAYSQGLTDFYTASKDYINGMRSEIVKLIQGIGYDRFTKREKDSLAEKFSKEHKCEIDVFSLLYQHGLLGWKGQNGQIQSFRFLINANSAHFKLPIHASEFLFHACIIDAVGIKPKKGDVFYFDEG